MLALGVEVGRPKKFGVNRNEALALGSAGCSTVLPRFGNSVVSFTKPNRDVWAAVGEIGQNLLGTGSGQAGGDGRKLENDDNKLQSINVHVTGFTGFGSTDASNNLGTPDNIKPEAEARAIGPASNKTGIST